MAMGKNKGLAKGGKKGQKKRIQDPFLRKVWYDVKAPTYFKVRKVCKTPVTKTTGQKRESDGLRGRIFELNMADINDAPEESFKQVKLEIQEPQGRSCLTDFHGLRLNREKMCALATKKKTLIEGSTDVKTTDGYTVRLFCLAFTKKPANSDKAFCYAQTAQIRKIRRKMVQVLQSEVGKGQLRDMVKALTLNKLEMDIQKHTKKIFPLDPIHIHKVKVVKKPKLDITKLMEVHDKTEVDTGAAMAVDEEPEAKNLVDA